MKKNSALIIILVMLLCMTSFGCNKKEEQPVDTLPDISSFSSEEYEDYEFVFPPVKSAVYYNNGTEEVIEPDDPRLIRLLNYITYSYEEDFTWRVWGVIKEREIATNESQDVPMLEVMFSPPSDADSPEEMSGAKHMLLCANAYMLYADPDQFMDWREKDTDRVATIFWPYMVNVYDYLGSPTDINEDFERFERAQEWGNDEWGDVLSAAGF